MTQVAEWFDSFRAGKEQSYRHAFDIYYRSVFYFALKILNGDTFAAEDVVNDSFRKAWDERSRLATEKHLENFLYLVTRNKCISHLRSIKTARNTEKEWARRADEVEERSPLDLERVQTRLMEVVFEKIALLPAGDILKMSYIDGKTTGEIAETLNISENSVYIHKSRSLKELRKMLTGAEWALFTLFFLHSSQLPAVDAQYDTLSSSKNYAAPSPDPYPAYLHSEQTTYRQRQPGPLGQPDTDSCN